MCFGVWVQVECMRGQRLEFKGVNRELLGGENEGFKKLEKFWIKNALSIQTVDSESLPIFSMFLFLILYSQLFFKELTN